MREKSVKSNFFSDFLFDHIGGHFGGDLASDQKFFDAEIFGRIALEIPRGVPVSPFALRDDFAHLDGAVTHAVIGNVSHFDIRDQLGDVGFGDGDLSGGFGVGCFHVSENDSFFGAVKFFFDFFSERGTFCALWNIFVEQFFYRGTFFFLDRGEPGLARLGKIPHSLYKHYIKGCRVPI